MPWARPCPGLRSVVHLVLSLCVVACAAPAGHTPPSHGSATGTPIYVTSNGWHTELVVETATLSVRGWPVDDPLRSRRYLEVGWGDRDAYPADRLTARLALEAALASRGSTLRVSGFDEAIPDRFRGIEVVEIRLATSALQTLARFIEASHAVDHDGRPIRLDPVTAGSGTFYLARGRFHALNTCNSWTARALQAAGLPLWPALTFTAHQLMLQVIPLGRLVATGPA